MTSKQIWIESAVKCSTPELQEASVSTQQLTSGNKADTEDSQQLMLNLDDQFVAPETESGEDRHVQSTQKQSSDFELTPQGNQDLQAAPQQPADVSYGASDMNTSIATSGKGMANPGQHSVQYEATQLPHQGGPCCPLQLASICARIRVHDLTYAATLCLVLAGSCAIHCLVTTVVCGSNGM